MFQLISLALAFIFFKNINAIMDCTVLFDGCVNDTTCWNSVGNTYYNACSPVWNTNYTYDYCPTGCKTALYNYLTYFNPTHNNTILTFCQCNTTDCETTRQKLIDIDCIDQDCRDLVTECQTNSSCNITFMNYYDACQDIIDGTWSNMNLSFCPTGCQDALDEFVAIIAPNYTTTSFCGCNGNTDCQAVKDNLEKYGCSVPSCTDVFTDCQNDVNCQPIAQAYYDSCNVVFNGSWQYGWCPNDCEKNLLAYLNYVNGNLTEYASFCECDGPTKVQCNTVKQDLYDLGCIGDSCTHVFYDCTLDSNCNKTAISYYTACEQVLNGSWTYDWCPSECTYWLWKYISSVAPNSTTTDFCDCYNNQACINAKKYLMDANCVNTDCPQLFVECENNATCAPYATTFKSTCGSILDGTYTGTTCPTGCSDAINNYITATGNNIINDQYCDCNGDTNCEHYLQTFFDVGCIVNDCSQNYFDCVNAGGNCTTAALNYFNLCQSVINGSWTTSNQCPDGCSDALVAYIHEVWNVTNLGLDNYCDCNYDTSCVSVKQRLTNSACYTSDSSKIVYGWFAILLSVFVGIITIL